MHYVLLFFDMISSFQRATKYKVAESRDSERYFKRFRSHSLVVDDQLPLTLPSSVQQSTDDLENDDREETVFDEGMLNSSE